MDTFDFYGTRTAASIVGRARPPRDSSMSAKTRRSGPRPRPRGRRRDGDAGRVRRYECPYCGQAEVVIRELLASFGDELRYVWRHLPLNDVHAHTQMAAEAAEAAGAQGAFWPMHDKLLDHQDALTPPDLRRYGADLRLDLERFAHDVHRHRFADHIAEDVTSADASGVAGTPSFFINGKRYEGAYDLATLTAAVRATRTRAAAARLRQPPVPRPKPGQAERCRQGDAVVSNGVSNRPRIPDG